MHLEELEIFVYKVLLLSFLVVLLSFSGGWARDFSRTDGNSNSRTPATTGICNWVPHASALSVRVLNFPSKLRGAAKATKSVEVRNLSAQAGLE